MKDEKEAKLENAIQPKSNINITRVITRVIIGLILCSILFIIHSISMFFVLLLIDNIVSCVDKASCKDEAHYIFGLSAILYAPIMSFYVCLYVFFLFLYKKNIYIFILVVPIFTFLIMKITGHKIINYFNISEYLGISEIIDMSIAILLYVITRNLIEKLILKDKK